MSVCVNVRMSKIMLTPIKVGVRTYATYANCRIVTVLASCVFTVEFAQISMPGEVVMAQLLQFTFPFNEWDQVSSLKVSD